MTHVTTKLLFVFTLLLGSGVTNHLLAQNLYRLAGKPVLAVKGTSTLHDWEMSSAQATGKAEMLVEGAGLKNVKSGSITMKAESLKSGKGKMDEIAYESLKTSKHTDIQFTLTSFKNLSGKKAQAAGNLTIAGVTKPVVFTMDTSINGELVSLAGEATIKFSDFNIKPPTAMMGTIKTGNELTLLFKVNFQQAAIQ